MTSRRKAPLFMAMTSLGLAACSLLSQRPAPPPKEGEKFGADSVWSENLMPVPAEIAADIAFIRSGRNPSLPPPAFANQDQKVWQDGVPPGSHQQETGEEKIADGDPNDRQPSSDPGAPGSRSNKKPRLPNALLSHAGDGSGKTESYIVKRGDTLMKIAFQKFGNVYRWREILNANSSQIPNFNQLTPGIELTIHGVIYVAIEQDGEIYLIRKGDTLVKISRTLYGSTQYWSNLWRKNSLLIRDPNKIYADFQMYYDPLEKILHER